ncbi:MAG: hypothetical protein AW07_03794 [Candidatus Accumulibacter sp. SK-11]|nr:MAG: hypothetical protein AW07_03794 [Candidatus Accumulibacter sp. SK-11]
MSPAHRFAGNAEMQAENREAGSGVEDDDHPRRRRVRQAEIDEDELEGKQQAGEQAVA